MADATATPIGWERALGGGGKSQGALRRATRELDEAGVLYAVVGGNAVAEWVARVDEEAIRNTRDVDILVRRGDFAAAKAASKRQGSSTIFSSTSMSLLTDPRESQAVVCICCSPVRKYGPTMSMFFRNSTTRSGQRNFK